MKRKPWAVFDKFPDIIELFFERRRYGSKTFTWVHATKVNGSRLKVLDPYPGVNWSDKSLTEELSKPENWTQL